jgi:acyl transferase domain-containing protein
LDFSQTGYFECHGTGTAVGDPIECAAIGNVFAECRTPEDPLLIGSIKTNLGHCEGASGLAAIIKVVHCLEKACIPATIGVKQLNPNSKHNIPLAELVEWKINKVLANSRL